MPHQNSFKERNCSPDRKYDRRRRTWIVRNYAVDSQPVVGRVELSESSLFKAIRPNDEAVGSYDTLTAARAALLPPPVKRK
jgi:hypothetical protein